MKVSGIYSIIHKPSKKVYIGQSNDVEGRLQKHRSWISNPTRVINRCLYNYAKKYSIEDFDFGLIETCEPSKLDEREMFWYEVFKPNTFNSRPNPVTNRGVKHTDEAKVINSQLRKEYYAVPENIEKRRAVLKEISQRPSWREKNKAAAVARMANPETRKKIREMVQSQENIDKVKATNFLRGNSNCVGQYSKDGSLVDFFLNVEDAARSVGKSRGNISSTLTGKLKSAYGYVWKYITNEEYLKLNNGKIIKEAML
jgi:group I intron endonuclease